MLTNTTGGNYPPTFNLNRLGNSTSVSYQSLWSFPELIKTVELISSIEMWYIETSMITYTTYPAPPPQQRVFKIIFSCIDGKWNKSERIYGTIIPAQNEQYEFE